LEERYESGIVSGEFEACGDFVNVCPLRKKFRKEDGQLKPVTSS
jgi:hypothetical protein